MMVVVIFLGVYGNRIYKTVSRRPSSAVTAFHCTFAMMGNLATKAAPSTLVRARKAWGPNEL